MSSLLSWLSSWIWDPSMPGPARELPEGVPLNSAIQGKCGLTPGMLSSARSGLKKPGTRTGETYGSSFVENLSQVKGTWLGLSDSLLRTLRRGLKQVTSPEKKIYAEANDSKRYDPNTFQHELLELTRDLRISHDD